MTKLQSSIFKILEPIPFSLVTYIEAQEHPPPTNIIMLQIRWATHVLCVDIPTNKTR